MTVSYCTHCSMSGRNGWMIKDQLEGYLKCANCGRPEQSATSKEAISSSFYLTNDKHYNTRKLYTKNRSGNDDSR